MEIEKSSPSSNDKRLIGLVKWFDIDRGYGVIETPEEEKFFLHIKSFGENPQNISKGTAIIFSNKIDEIRNRNAAINSHLIDHFKDWKLALNYLGKSDDVRIEIEVNRERRRGNPYRREIQSFSLIDLSTKQFFNDKSENEITTAIIDYFDNYLDNKYFILYCKLIENMIKEQFSDEISANILKKVFYHFGENLNEEILFNVWKEKRFKYIYYTDNEEYEIPENVLKSNINNISIPELRRIMNYSFGSNFCSQFTKTMFCDIENFASDKIKDLYPLLEFESENEREKRKLQLDNIYVKRIEVELTKQANELDIIRNNTDFNNYKLLLQRIPNQFDNKIKNKIKNLIYKIIASKCSEEFKPEIWIKGIIDDIPFESVLKKFFDINTQTEEQLTILSKLQTDEQFELLKEYSVKYDIDKAFALIKELALRIDHCLDFSKFLFDFEFWKDKKCRDLIDLFVSYAENESSEEQKYELFFKGYVKNVPKRIAKQDILNLDKNRCRKIFENLSEDKSFILELLEDKITINDTSTFDWICELAKEFLGIDKFKFFDKKGFKIIEQSSDEEQKYTLFFKGYGKEFSKRIVKQIIHNLDENQCRKIFENLSEDKTFILELLEDKITNNHDASAFDWLYELANKFLDNERFILFDKKNFNILEQSKYFVLWEVGKARIFPENYIGEKLDDNYDNYAQIGSWINNHVTNKEEITNFLFSYLDNQIPVKDRIIFYKQLNYIKYLTQIDVLNLERIKQLQNDFYNIILWFLDKEEVFDYELLKQKFIYFAPDEQVRIIRKLFCLKAKGQFDLTVEKLNELTRFDLDLYKTSLNFNPDIPIDISTDVIIKALLSYKQNHRFFVESELLNIVLEDLKNNRTRKFRLSNYFENCEGRQIAEFDWHRNGEISKVNNGDNQFYFAIIFDYELYLVEAVRKLPGRRWNNNTQVWDVPSKYEKEVLEFARNNRFFLNFEGGNCENNPHLAVFKRENKPNGIIFCEGRLANRLHQTFKQKFWWCVGQPCFSKCETIHTPSEWEKYTLLDFCEILGFNTDETTKEGDVIPKGYYYQFVALINSFNRLLEKLYCQECHQILFPVEIAFFAAHNIVRFYCINEDCSNYKKEIYLNHCLNGQCNNIIDSRISKKCSNGLFICDQCGSCCSHSMFERRLNILQLTDIPNNSIKQKIIDDLAYKIENKLGHMERKEYFCYKCGCKIKEIYNDIFQCSNCGIQYDATKYHLKRPHKHLTEISVNKDNNSNKDNYESNDDSLSQ